MDAVTSPELHSDQVIFLADRIDAEFYRRQALALGLALDLAASALSAAEHYSQVGAELGLSPHPWFSPSFYRKSNPDVELEPFEHYARFGLAEGRRPHPLLRSLAGPEDLASCEFTPALADATLFDAAFYDGTHPDVRLSGLTPLRHYLAYGCLDRRSPHPLFSPCFYQARSQARAIDLYVDYLVQGAERGFDPHPLFMGAFAARPTEFGGDARDVFARFIADPWSGGRPHPLFDLVHYRQQVQGGFGPSRNPLIHYLTDPGASALSPHPMFDPAYYRAQLEQEPNAPLLLHYVVEGWREGASPHRLFDPASFEQNSPAPRTEAPLVRYALQPPTVSPHYLIDAPTYLQARGPVEIPLLADYLARSDRAAAAFHVLFDVAHYTGAVRNFALRLRQRATGEAYQALRRIFSASAVRDDPIGHYIAHGWRAGLSPHPAFDPTYYREQAGELEGDPLADYLRDGGQARHSPCIGFDLGTYLVERPDCDPARELPYAHFLRQSERPRPRTNGLLNPADYLSTYRDLRLLGVDPVQHYIEHGQREERRPNRAFSPRHALDVDAEISLKGETAAGLYLKRRGNRPKILFVGHEASLSGAPLILLRLIEALGTQLDCELHTLLAHGGVLEEDFRKASHTVSEATGYDLTFHADSQTHDPDWEIRVNAVLDRIGLDQLVLAVCNTVETRSYADLLSARGVPVVSLIHEPADTYTSAQILGMYRASRSVIFPSQYTAERARKLTGAHPPRFLIRGQGLLDPFIGRGDREAARRTIRTQLGLPQDAMIVLGCGSVERRKGVDYFVDVAAQVVRKRDDCYFVWVGAAAPGWDSAKRWVDFALSMNGAEERVRFVPPQGDMSPYYLAADLMLLPSRLDPFPCVVHEAMAAALPIVAFEGCSGAAEAFGGGGVLTPPLDVEGMTQATLSLLSDSERRGALGRIGVERVETLWNNDDYVRDLLEEIEDATALSLPKRRGPRHPHGGRKVFLLQPDWSISGVNTFAQTLVQGLRGMGFDARFLFTRGRFTPFDKDHEPDVPATYLQPEVDRPDVIWRTLLDFLKRERPCVVIPNYDYLTSGVAPVAPEGVGFIGIAHSDDVEHYAHVYRLGLYWNRIVAVSRRIETRISEMNPAFDSRLSTIHYGVPFDAAAGERALLSRISRARAGVQERPLRIVYSGRLIQKQKRVLEFINLADRLQAAGTPFHLTLIGDGPQADLLANLMSTRIQAGEVSLPGRLGPDQIYAQLMEADVFVLLSDFEGLPLSMLEAMALGVVPVVRDVESGVREVIEDGLSGHLCSRWSLDDMVSRLSTLQKDVDRLEAMGRATLAAMGTHALGDDEMVKRYAELIDEVFAQKASRGFSRPAPHAHDAPHRGISIPSWMYPKFEGPEDLLDEETAYARALDIDED